MSDTEREAPKRLRAADVIDNLQRTIEALTTRTTEPSASIQFSRNAKGETQIETKLYVPGGTDRDALAALVADALLTAKEAYEDACAAYPTASGFVRNEGQK